MALMSEAKNNILVQTRLSKTPYNYIRKKAKAEGISVAAYIRRMIIQEYEAQKAG